jgi:hypothetical protein
MSTTFAPTNSLTWLPAIPLDLVVVCVVSLFGLTLSAAVLSYVSSEMIGVMFSSIA